MHKQVIFIFLFFIVGNQSFGQNSGNSSIPKNAPFIMHVVKAGETLTKIAKNYNVTLNEILKANPSLTADNLNPEQIIRIPNKSNKKVLSSSKTDDNVLISKEKDNVILHKKNAKYHMVEKGQTMYAISKLYGIKVEEIQQWNKLKDYNVKAGTQLIVSDPLKYQEPKAEVKEIKAKEPSSPNIKQAADNEPVNNEREVQSVAITEKPETQAVENETQSDLAKLFKENSLEKKLTAVRGTGAPMTTSLGAMESVYFVMHKWLSIGSIIKIKNLMNNKVLYAKVIGKLPETDENKHVIIRYSLGVKKDLKLQNGKCYVEIEYP